MDVVGAGVVSLVAVVCRRKLEVSGHHVKVIDSWLGVVGCSGVCCRGQDVVRVSGGWLGVVRMIDSRLGVGACGVVSSEGELEDAWVLWPDGASDGEAGTLHHLLLALGNPLYEGDDWLKHICNKTEVTGLKQQIYKHRGKAWQCMGYTLTSVREHRAEET